MNILTMNAGSSSIKFRIFRYNKNKTILLLSGQISQIKAATAVLNIRYGATEVTEKLALTRANTYLSAIEQLCQNTRFNQVSVDCVINRIVHGGDEYKDIVLLHPKTLNALSKHNSLAPVYQPYNIKIAEYFLNMYPKIKHYACFDTGFHQTIPLINQLYDNSGQSALNLAKGFGYYGLSYSYIAKRLHFLVENKLAKGNWLIVHLGGGSSICGIKNGKSIVVTPGFSLAIGQLATDGCDDMEVLLASKDEKAKTALKLYALQIASGITKLATVLGGMNGIVFTGKIGENSPEIRALILSKLEWLGIKVNKKANNSNKLKIFKKDCPIKILVVPTNEELAMVNQLIEHKL